MRIYTTLILCMLGFLLSAQPNLNMEIIANVDFGGEASNDIWGYVDDAGIEYAVIGNADHTRVFSLEDETAPEMVYEVVGSNSVWRDIKSWNNHLYITCDEGNDGLLIIDMTRPDSINHVNWRPDITAPNGVGSTLRTCHNIYIDNNGICYLSGCNIGAGGVIMLDIITDPNNPTVIGIEDNAYSHDAYARDNILYSSDIQNGFFSIYDVTDPENPVLLGRANTSSNFTHNAWLSDDGTHLFTTDERPNGFVDSYDISDLDNIQRVDMFQPLETAGNGVIPHNTHVQDDYLVTSWYTDGVVITDANQPDNLIKVGQYDTWPGADGGFNGCWGVYPYLPSGRIIASDIQTGLYVFGVDYVRAAYLEGTVTDADSGVAINNAAVEIISDVQNGKSTNAMGEYKTGIVEAGTFDVLFTHPDYLDLTLSATIENGVVTVLDAQMTSLPRFTVKGDVFDVETNEMVQGAQIIFLSATRTEFFTSDPNGEFEIELIEDEYEVLVGAWGYMHKNETGIDPNIAGDLSFGLDFGYMDDFFADLGWTVESNASTGAWERADPIGTGFQGTITNIDIDDPLDLGEECYVTGNGGGGAGDDDIDDGFTRLISPSMDLSRYNNPVIEFRYHFFNGGGFGGEANDSLKVMLDDGSAELVLVGFVNQNSGGWTGPFSFTVGDFTSNVNDVKLVLIAEDSDPGHITEAAVDVFRVLNGGVNTNDLLADEFNVKISPNPFETSFNLSWTGEFSKIELFDIVGHKVSSVNVDGLNSYFFDEEIKAGAYLLRLIDAEGVMVTQKLIKQ